MKKNHIITMLGAAVAVSLSFNSCSDVLEETPRSTFTVDFFKTNQGVIGGLTDMYAHLRQMYGQGYYLNAMETGTDEFTYGQSADENFKDADRSAESSTPTASNQRSDVIWHPCFVNINTANAVIEYGTANGVEAALLAEAHFFRAFDYFLLVQTFGGVPLDLGSGELKVNTQPKRTSVRNTVAEVYTKCIFPDLEKAVADLPENPRMSGTVTKTVARLYLSKAYLTYAWWLENPNNIPTYPECERKDPNGKSAKDYFQLAYNVATEAIDNPGPYKLQETFYDMCVYSNERNAEMLLWADHTESSELFNGGSLTYGSGGAPDNFAFWMYNWNYTSVQIGKSAELTAAGTFKEPVTGVAREAKQGLGRPWSRMAPTYEVLTKTFTNKDKDSRYDATFMTVYRGNWNQNGETAEVLYGGNGLEIRIGEPVITFLPEDTDGITYYADKNSDRSKMGLGVKDGVASYVVDPRHVSRLRYPGPFKTSGQRTDYDAKSALGDPNAGSTRPFYIAKFSELYLVAAEAAVKGATTAADKSASDLVNVLRARAGKWSFSVAENQEVSRDFSADLMVTEADVDLDFILDERSREFYGEGYRWLDLVRTQTWAEKAKTYQICGMTVEDTTLETFERTIDPGMYLYPIPQGQIDGLEVSQEEKDAYQNPYYRGK